MDETKIYEVIDEMGDIQFREDLSIKFTSRQLLEFVRKIEKRIQLNQLENFVTHMERGIGKRLHSVKMRKNMLEADWND